MSEEQSRFLAFDQFQRYQFIRRIVELASRGSAKKILEVGGAHSSPLADWLAGHQVVVLDRISAPNLNLVAGGLHLPFPSHAFDFVVSTDVLEHLDIDDRPRFLDELQRVSSEMMVLGFPHESRHTNQVDRILLEFIREQTGSEYPFLTDHLQHGLPNRDSVIAAIRSQMPGIFEFENANVYSWLLLMMSYFLIEKHPEFDEARTLLSEFFNDYYEHLSHQLPSYRTFLVCFKTQIDPLLRLELDAVAKQRDSCDPHAYAATAFVLSMIFENALKRNKDTANQDLERQKELSLQLQNQVENLHKDKEELVTQFRKEQEALRRKQNEIDSIHKEKEELIVEKIGLSARIAQMEEALHEKEKQVQEQQKQLTDCLSQLENLRQYLNLFLNHPVYKLYKFFKR